MKKLIYIIAATILSLTACKTSEANYKAAYDKVMERDRAGIDSTVYAKIRQEARPHKVVLDGDTLAMRSEYVRLTPGMEQNPELFRQYNVVTGQYKQLFTAKNLRKRLVEAGFENSIIIQTREPLYYVVAVSAATPAEAKSGLEQVRKSGFPLRDPFPWILKKP